MYFLALVSIAAVVVSVYRNALHRRLAHPFAVKVCLLVHDSYIDLLLSLANAGLFAITGGREHWLKEIHRLRKVTMALL